MSKRAKYIKKSFYALMLLFLVLPVMQHYIRFIELDKLKGSFKRERVKLPPLSLKNLSTNDFQTKMEAFWLNEIGFRNWFIRINNQLNYSLFNVANAKSVIITKDNLLLTEYNIKSFLGEDFIGDKRMEELVTKIQFIQDTLAKRGTYFFVFIAPNKVSIYKENIPDKYYKIYKPGKTNYEEAVKKLNEKGINLFDARAIITSSKKYYEYAIFPKNGVHWSGNTVALMSDTLANYLDKHLEFDIPDIQLSKGEVTVKNYRYTDYDMGEAMNLLWSVADDELHYPEVTYKRVAKNKPNVLGVGDSFIQSFTGFYPIFDTIFSEQSNMWYYNRIMGWPLNYKSTEPIPISKLDLELELKSRDLIFLEMTEENIKNTGYKFIDDLYDQFTGKNKILPGMKSLYKSLEKDPEVIKETEHYYKLVGYTKEQMKHSLIKNKLKNQWLIDFDYDAEVEKTKKAIRNNKKWLNGVKEKAIINNIDLEEAIRRDAVWIVNNKLKN